MVSPAVPSCCSGIHWTSATLVASESWEKEHIFNKHSKRRNYIILNEFGSIKKDSVKKWVLLLLIQRPYSWCYGELEIKDYNEAIKCSGNDIAWKERTAFLVRKSAFKFRLSSGYWPWPLHSSVFSSWKWKKY